MTLKRCQSYVPKAAILSLVVLIGGSLLLLRRNTRLVRLGSSPLKEFFPYLNDIYAAAGKGDVTKGSKPQDARYYSDSDVLESGLLSNISMQPDIDAQIDSFDPERMPKIPFMRNYRNPCWYEVIPAHHHSRDSQQAPKDKDAEDKKGGGKSWRLRCLPLVYLIGVESCGTAELTDALTQHPEVVPGLSAKPNFWGGYYAEENLSFGKYLDLYDSAAESIRSSFSPKEVDGREVQYHAKVTIDASPRTSHVSGGNAPNEQSWMRQTADYIPARPMRDIAPDSDTKIVMIVRNPTARLFSFYTDFSAKHYDGTKMTSEMFQRHVVEYIGIFKACVTLQSLDACAYEHAMNQQASPMKINIGVYYAFIKHWLKVFPDMKVIRLEDLRKDANGTISDMLGYLGLDTRHSLEYREGKEPNTHGFKLFDKTKDLLDEFYRPYNRMLADLLHDERFLFED